MVLCQHLRPWCKCELNKSLCGSKPHHIHAFLETLNVFQDAWQDRADQPYDIQNDKTYDIQNDPQIHTHPFTNMYEQDSSLDDIPKYIFKLFKEVNHFLFMHLAGQGLNLWSTTRAWIFYFAFITLMSWSNFVTSLILSHREMPVEYRLMTCFPKVFSVFNLFRFVHAAFIQHMFY